MTEVFWFRNAHEDRNDWLRFGFMRLHLAGEIRFEERPLSQAATEFGFESLVTTHLHRHTSVVAIRSGGRVHRIVIDSEDSFFCLSPLITACDLYFCAGYNRQFFVDRRFEAPYPWQSEVEVAAYRERANLLISTYGHVFDRVRPFAPIGPNLHDGASYSWPVQKVCNAYHRCATLISGRRSPWLMRYLDFERRYRHLLSLRRQEAPYDIVLNDTLWGWPRHRFDLHRRLVSLAAQGYRIHSRLSWQDPLTIDGGTSYQLPRGDFPIETGQIVNYETMLSGSRLGVFATGFHYGWRNILTLAMFLGLPIYCDPFIIAHAQDYGGYTFHFNRSGAWDDLAPLIDRYRDDAYLERTKIVNRECFDRVLTPEAVARSLLHSATAPKQASSPAPALTIPEAVF